MKQYPEYKDSGIEWIGKIPKHWDCNRIKYANDIIMGQSPESIGYNKDMRGLPFLQGNADFREIYPFPSVWCENCNKTVHQGDILVSVRAPVGAVNIANQVYGIGRGLCAVSAKDSFNKYLFYVFKIMSDELNSIGAGSTYNAISSEDIRNLLIPLPPFREQKDISRFLDNKIEQIDRIFSKKSILLELLKEQRAAMINRAVTKGLNPNAPMKDSGIEWLGKIPQHWEVKKLKFISEITLGKMLTPMDKGGMLNKPYLRAKNLNWLNVDLTDIKNMWFSRKELTQYLLKKGDLLVSEGGEVGRTCMWDEDYFECYIQNSVNRVRFNNIKYNSKYFLYLFFIYGKMGHFDAIVSRVSIAHLTKEKLAEIYIIIPTLMEQNYIVAHLEKELIKIKNALSKIEIEIELLKEYRTALISEVVTGKIDVRDSGPD